MPWLQVNGRSYRTTTLCVRAARPPVVSPASLREGVKAEWDTAASRLRLTFTHSAGETELGLSPAPAG